MDTIEQWRPVPGCDGYEVSDQGRILSRWRKRPLIMRFWTDPHGYLMVTLAGGRDKPLRRGVHQLVLLAFMGPPPDGLLVRHLDGNPANNRLTNLRYGTYVENVNDSLQHGTHYNASKTECRLGHPLGEWNGRQRRCETCAHNGRQASDRRYAERRSLGITGRPVASRCKRGHPFDETNTMIVQGYRRCRACQKMRAEKVIQNRRATMSR